MKTPQNDPPLVLPLSEELGPNTEKPAKRLWVVRVMYEAYVLAADEEEARSRQSAIEHWEDFPKVQAYPYLHEELEGWTDDCLVYCAEDENDLTLGAAKALALGPNVELSGRTRSAPTQG